MDTMEEKIKKGKKLMNGLMDVTGNLEALVGIKEELENSSIAYVNGNNHTHFGAIISLDKAEKIKKYCTDVVNEEIEVYDKKLDELLHIDNVAVELEQPDIIESENDNVAMLDIDDIKASIRKGVTIGKIAEEYGVDKKKIYKFLEKNETSVKALQP